MRRGRRSSRPRPHLEVAPSSSRVSSRRLGQRLEVQGEDGNKLQVVAEVLRVERNPGHPLAALQLLGETDEWRGLIWEPAAPRVTAPPPPVEDDDEDDEEDDELAH